MGEIGYFFEHLFSTKGFPARWFCGQWSSFHGWLYIISDLLIWSAYFTMPVIIIQYVYGRNNLRFQRIYILFAAFILACGSTHFIDALIFWYPYYRLSALVRLATGIISWVTVFYLIKILPTAFTLKTAEQLEEEVERRKKVEEQLRINNDLLTEAQNIAMIGHWQWDTVKNIVTWSKTLYTIFGVEDTDTAINFEKYISLIHPDDRDYVEDTISQAMAQNKFGDFYHRIILHNGTIRTIHGKGQVVINERNEKILIGTAQDVTDIKKTEQELLAKTKALEASNVELEKFASVASHDLREPLRKISAFSSMLHNEERHLLTEKGNLYLEKIQNASNRMQKLIDDILNFSKLTTEAIEFKKVNLNEVIDGVLSDLEVLIVKKHAHLNIEVLPEIEGNATQLGQLFFNLITNAIKFSKAGIDPLIHIKSEFIRTRDLTDYPVNFSDHKLSILGNPRYWENELFCKITVTDNGIGFDEAYLDRIFMIFQRLHSQNEYEGTGIGLALCQKVTEIHHGSITAESTPGIGTTFIIILPVSQKNFRIGDK